LYVFVIDIYLAVATELPVNLWFWSLI